MTIKRVSNNQISKYISYDYFTRNQWIVYSLILFVGFIFRWYNLSLRPFHHDEGLYAQYAYYWFTDPNKFYRYNPLLHGPFLFHFYVALFKIFGASDFIIRAPIALMGSCFLFLPYIYRNYFKANIVIFLTFFLALSPTLIYWSRFVRHDFYVFCALIMIVYGFTLSESKWRLFWIALGFGLHVCIKENAYVNLALILGYIIYEYLLTRETDWSMAKKLVVNIKENPIVPLIAIGAYACLFVYFYSAGFKFPQGVIDGLYDKSFSYWLHQHSIERLTGPFSFQTFFLAWYELPFTLMILGYLAYFYYSAPQIYKKIGLGVLILAILNFFIFRNTDLPKNPFWNLFKLKISVDIITLIIVVAQSIITTTFHIKRRERGLAFWGYTFFAAYFTYSYLGEKVPWLSLYYIVPGLIFFSLLISHDKYLIINKLKSVLIINVGMLLAVITLIIAIIFAIEENVANNIAFFTLGTFLLIVSLAGYVNKIKVKINLNYIIISLILIYNFRMTLITNFTRANSDDEFIRQVHTTKKAHDLFTFIKNKNKTTRQNILSLNAIVWPTIWYLKNTGYYHYLPNNMKPNQFQYVFDDKESIKQTMAPYVGDYQYQYIPFRSWWVPDYKQMTLKKFMIYAIDHKPWNPSGALWAHTYTKK